MFASALSTSQLLEERAAASRFLDCILGSIPMGIVTLDEQLCVTHCNRAARELLGIGEHPSALATLETLFPCDVSPCVKELIQELKCTGVSACVEIERRPSPTRDPIPLGLSVWALLQGRGIPTDILIVIEDLSLRREISELRHLSEVKSHFISLISHELRTPLTSMKGSLHLLRHVKGFELPEKQSRLLEIVDRNTQRLAGLVENLLEVQNLESGETRIDLKPEPLEEIVLECLEERSAAWENKQIHCRFLADGAAKSELPLDRERIKHVFKHIIDNAFKYSNPEGEVTVEIAECQGWAEIRVTNTGPPIPAKYRGKIFDKFWQVESTMTRETGGSGLGLYLAKRVVALHRGEIGLERSDETGTTFLVRLPMLSAASWLPGL
ncbi:MAG: Alginate biosynthesis sensor protein KinB [candidate division BRC1 bacterium ADurb.BinA364]|nr:MAG: Alginate biosynthesis sensor protein KinB [candidate division BRC1 bacterium ADurb.BinA364]